MEPMVDAVQFMDVEQVEALLQENPILAQTQVTHRDPRGESLLHLIVPDLGKPTTPEHLQIANLLLDYGTDINAAGYPANNEGGTPLIFAAWADQPELVRLFLERGADMTARTLRGETALDQAARHGNIRVVEVLLETGASSNLPHLLQAGMTERVRTMLNAQPGSLHQRDEEGNLPIHHVVGPENRYDPALLTLLLERGADIEACDKRGRTALHCALDAERQDAVELLLSHGAVVDIFAAAGSGDAERVEAMLQNNPTLATARQSDGITPLFYAARSGHVRIAELLLEQGAAADIYVERWWMEPTPLHAAVLRGHSEMCRLLLDAGAAMEQRNEHGYTPLLVAVRWGHIDVVTLLLDRCADLHTADDNGMSALDWATSHLSLSQLLVARGFDVNRKAPVGSWSERTALHFAAAQGKADVIRFLLDSGAAPTLTDRQGRTPREVLPQAGRKDLEALFPS